jgi:hypothetical protein
VIIFGPQEIPRELFSSLDAAEQRIYYSAQTSDRFEGMRIVDTTVRHVMAHASLHEKESALSLKADILRDD